MFGGFTNSASLNGDKQVTLIALQTLASQHGGLWVSPGCCRPTPNRRSAPTSITGRFGGAAGADPADAGVDEMLSGDLATAKLYGQRVAGFAAKLA